MKNKKSKIEGYYLVQVTKDKLIFLNRIQFLKSFESNKGGGGGSFSPSLLPPRTKGVANGNN